MSSPPQLHFAVIGAGVVGLSTALELQRRQPQATVTVLADRFGVDTTSDVAAGLIRPCSSFTGPTPEITHQFMVDSYAYWRHVFESPDRDAAGVREVNVVIVSNTHAENVQNPFLEAILPNYEFIDFTTAAPPDFQRPRGHWRHGAQFTTLLADCRHYLPWATQRFLAAGGHIRQQHIAALLELHGQYAAVFNCTGLGARWLCADRAVLPLRGQIVRVHAPHVRNAMYVDFDTYLIPVGRAGELVLGGCRQYENYSRELCAHDRAAIVERCERACEGVRAAPVLREQCGLRPHRAAVRVECERLPAASTATESMLVVHNYGHGGYGVTMGPGTARYAVELAMAELGLK